MKSIRTLLLLALAALMAIFAGCAKERTGPFDVPGPAPMRANADSADGALMRAAAEIAASAIYFDFNKSAIRPEARVTLERVASLLKQYPAIGINIEGHCDERGGSEYNYALGERRARAAYTELVARGINPAQVYMVTYGKETPASPGHTESAYARNRRAVFVVVTTCR